MKTLRTEHAWLAAILVAGAALRIVGLNSQLWFDEIATLVDFVRLPFGEIISDYSSLNNHMFYTLQAKAAIAVFGEAPWSLRLPAFVFGVASIAMIYVLARAHGSARVALAAAALTALSYHHIWFSQNARGYTELGFFCLLATASYLDLLSKPSRVSGVVLAASVAGALYTHLTAGFYIAALGLHWLGRQVHRVAKGNGADGRRIEWPAFISLTAGGIIALLAYAPALPAIVANVGGVSETSAVDVMKHYQNPLWALAEGLRTLGGPAWFGLAAAPVAAIVLVFGGVSLWRRAPAAAIILGLSIGVTLLALTALSMRIWPRFFFVQLPLIFWLLAEGADALAATIARRLPLTRRIGGESGVFSGGIAVALAIFAALASRNYAAPKQNYLAPAQYLMSQRADPASVAAIGLASFPYNVLYNNGFSTLPDPTPQNIEASQWIIIAFPSRTLRRYPESAEILEREFAEPIRFKGTLGDGAVLLYRRK